LVRFLHARARRGLNPRVSNRHLQSMQRLPGPPLEQSNQAQRITDELLVNNERYAEGFDKGELPLRPAKGDRGRHLHGRPPRCEQAAWSRGGGVLHVDPKAEVKLSTGPLDAPRTTYDDMIARVRIIADKSAGLIDASP
jgi:hypothetical protein